MGSGNETRLEWGLGMRLGWSGGLGMRLGWSGVWE